MRTSTKTMEFKFERTIPASPGEVFDGWLNPKIPGNPWNAAEKFVLDPKVDGLFYWTLNGTSHYGRFTVALFPVPFGLPRYAGGSASTTNFRGLLELHAVTACRIAHPPFVGFVTRLRSTPVSRFRTLASYQVLPTTTWVGPSPTDGWRRTILRCHLSDTPMMSSRTAGQRSKPRKSGRPSRSVYGPADWNSIRRRRKSSIARMIFGRERTRTRSLIFLATRFSPEDQRIARGSSSLISVRGSQTSQ
jgi:hypothetical protein